MHAITLPLLFPVVCVGLLVFSHGSDAFAGVSAGVPDHGGVTKRDARPIVPRRVLILPDSRAKVSEDKDLWHHHLKVGSRMLLIGASICSICNGVSSGLALSSMILVHVFRAYWA